ncbi:hypothetical protein FOZ60_006570 [Perkinsus olseni]|uniref:3'-5' exonuclease domain-containing protein n=1 Tax=Perkinsus olseni TaxID=32597 RepID=A0A7J6NNC6_PEROL|nr:hypothetical protein FOZ60_006570 [Perkinsus olseni]
MLIVHPTRATHLARRFRPFCTHAPGSDDSSRYKTALIPEGTIEPLRRGLASALSESRVRTKLPKYLGFIDTAEKAKSALPSILANDVVGVDCEGVGLSRWGRLCVMQISAGDTVFVCDALRAGVIENLRPVLEASHIRKVFHDCREDSAALWEQFSIKLEGVYDTQAAHLLLLKRQSQAQYHISLDDLCVKIFEVRLGTIKGEESAEGVVAKMAQDPNVWFYRPLQPDMVSYAARDVMCLPLLKELMSRPGSIPREESTSSSVGVALLGESEVMARSEEHVAYCHLNEHIRRPRELEKRGRRLDALLTAVNSSGMYFKLNCGRQGVVCRPQSMAKMHDLQVGDVVQCYVSGWNPSGSVIFLERYERGTREAAMIDTVHEIRHPDMTSPEGMYGRSTTALLQKLDDKRPLTRGF